MIRVLVKMTIYGILVHVIVKIDGAGGIGEYLDIKNCACKKRLLGKLLLVCDNEILSTTEATSILDKKVLFKKSSYPGYHIKPEDIAGTIFFI